ncbi:carbohydrate ABC transporter permease [Actinacidiphila oryziradicis]|uniref:carbohydrate ABC transporter permease n=1 Tax=Actinacidiphila oryziradicis TaxID=2571141 RepID=UPI0023F4A99A|nr:carbohydrate ABC transporter permease [Actinacidiphila oryziradicis]MCW2875848.1 carbohydrate transporter permease [Actinacidiphila oryziradicis]
MTAPALLDRPTTPATTRRTDRERTRGAGHARRITRRTVVYALLTGYALISAYPFLWMVSGAFKNSREVLSGGHLIPHHPTLATLAQTWSQLHFLRYFGNSLIITLGTTVGVLLVYSLAGYAFGVLDFPGRRLLYGSFVALLFVPGITLLLPIVILQNKLDLLGTRLGLILPSINGTAPLAVMLLTSAFRSVPRELRESARMDGAGELRTFWSIFLPSCRPALVTIALLTAIPTWNEFVLARVSLSDPSTYTLPLGLQNLSSSAAPQQNVLMAASLIIIIPVVLLFVFLQRYFVNGLTGAVKG